MLTNKIKKSIKTHIDINIYKNSVPRKLRYKFTRAINVFSDIPLNVLTQFETNYWLDKQENPDLEIIQMRFYPSLFEEFLKHLILKSDAIDWEKMFLHIDYVMDQKKLNDKQIIKSKQHNLISEKILENYYQIIKTIKIDNKVNEKLREFLKVLN